MEHVVRIKAAGGIEQLEYAGITLPPPGPGEILVRHEAIGVNFLDTYHRAGLYPLPLPAVLGAEAAGIVEMLGPGVADLAVGDRIAYAGHPVGAYASARILPAARAVKLPATVDARLAAGSLLKGLTAHMLLTRIYPVVPGSTLLVLGAAGGLGSLLTQWAKRLGARVIGTVGSEAKAEVARANGADAVIVGRDADLPAEVRKLTDGRGVDVAYDGIGGTRLPQTLDCVRPFGLVASIGQAAGPIPPLAVEALGPRRSLTFARPSVMAYAAEAATYATAAAAVLEMLGAGLAPTHTQHYALADAARVHAELESGKSAGSIILLP
ncbi:quinone oxidoreductase [Dongia sp.]|uniref:quinone oxidoreductase family protein n=1 Tax=Dongia sp. TaxID=1977262 RepID=UPI0035B1B7B0